MSEKLVTVADTNQMAQNGIMRPIYVIETSFTPANSVRKKNRSSIPPKKKKKKKRNVKQVSKDENERSDHSVDLQYPFKREESSIGKEGWSVDHQSRRV